MFLGGALILAAIACYIANKLLTIHYISKNAPGLFDVDLILPPLNPGEEYLWEKSARTGMVPKWVSVIGLLAIPLLIVGVLIVLVYFFL